MTANSDMPLIGFTVGSEPKPVYLLATHTIVTGTTGLAGKTTAWHGFASRWKGKKFIGFITKRGENPLAGANMHKPFYKQPKQIDWKYLQGLVELTLKHGAGPLTTAIMEVCDMLPPSFDEAQKIADKKSAEQKPGFKKDMFYQLSTILKDIVKEIAQYDFANKLNLQEGINLMDISQFSDEMKGMIIGAIADEITDNLSDCVLVVPEAWQTIASEAMPAAKPVEALARLGRSVGNFVIIDTQDLASVITAIRKHCNNILLGKQSGTDQNEVERTIDAIPLPSKQKPKPEDIQTLRLGQFIAVIDSKTYTIFAMPAWMDEKTAIECAKNPELVYTIKAPEPEQKPIVAPVAETKQDSESIRQIVKAEVQAAMAGLAISQAPKEMKGIEPQKIPAELSTVLYDLTVKEHIIQNPNFDDSTLDGQIMLLIAEGKFRTALSAKDIHELVERNFGLQPSYRIGESNDRVWRSKELKPALEKLSQRPFAFLVRDGEAWKESSDVHSRLRKQVMPVTSA